VTKEIYYKRKQMYHSWLDRK